MRRSAAKGFTKAMPYSRELIDTHAHLSDQQFDADREAVIHRAHENNVSAIITVADSLESWSSTIQLAQQYPDLYAAIGIHPHNADAAMRDPRGLQKSMHEIVVEQHVVAVGETGLDYYKNYASVELQKKLFLLHCVIAGETERPLIIHCRSAYADLIMLLRDFCRAHGTSCTGVVHCFSGTYADAEELGALGLFLGIDGPITFPNSASLRDTIARVPITRLLIETDCPYLAPQAFRGKRNEPMFLSHIARAIAEVKNRDESEVCAATTKNARGLFQLSGR
ncbi:MAG: YchF/TatD family DNA exonuclease [Elusimicrobia bacterium]|nr:YchF/TatD family DNA exonuclease [Elusimicrobiota bacterium]MBD3412002.1 YchF/TatD family DNA exonuclease [Elusimicrobiota bacterium]